MTASRSNKPTAESMRNAEWATPAGRLIEWIRRYAKVRSRIAAGMVTWCWQEAIAEIGKDAALAAVEQAGLQLPAFISDGISGHTGGEELHQRSASGAKAEGMRS